MQSRRMQSFRSRLSLATLCPGNRETVPQQGLGICPPRSSLLALYNRSGRCPGREALIGGHHPRDAAGVQALVTDFGIKFVRPDIAVLTIANQMVGVVEIKKAGDQKGSSILTSPTVIGELFDQI
jgi:hypothetical protein